MDPARLKTLEVFASLDTSVLTELAQVVEERVYADGQTVFSEGDHGDTLFGVIEGVVRIEKRIEADQPATKTLSLLTPGDLFGEMSVIDSKPRSASAIASGPTHLLTLSQSALESLLTHSPPSAVRLLFSLMRAMNERIRRLNSSVVAYDEVGRGIGASEQLQPLLDLVLRQLLVAIGAEWGIAFLKAEFHTEFEARCRLGLSATAIPVERPSSRSLVARMAEHRSGWVIADRTSDVRCASAEPRDWESPSMILAPIQVSSGVLGVLAFGHSRPHRFDLNHLILVEGIARQTAQGILNLQHREEQHSRARLGRQFVKF